MRGTGCGFILGITALSLTVLACEEGERRDHGPIAADIMAPMGEPLPSASEEQLAAFERGRQVALRRFELGEGLGPVFNVTFCASCHEKPTVGGSAGLYRNFVLTGETLDGAFFLGNSVEFNCGELEEPPEEREKEPPPECLSGVVNGVSRLYGYTEENTARPDPEANLEITAQRNAIPFFGVGLLAEIDDAEILKRADPDDKNGDGISGKANYFDEFIGRFGLKAQTTSIEGFIRGPLYNHLGITTDPLSDEMRANLPVPSAAEDAEQALRSLGAALHGRAQVAAPGVPNCDLDDAPDPELPAQDLFDLVSFSMLLAAPEIEPLSEQTRRGLRVFDELGCHKCHTPRLKSERGLLPVYSDLLLHDMGPELADGLVFGDATGSEFRTQPLWGLSAVGPYLHDGRATTIDEAIRWHGGEAEGSKLAYVQSITERDREDLIEFLLSLGGRSQASQGLVPPQAPVPNAGEYGAPLPDLSAEETEDFRAGRRAFDREFGYPEGAGAPRFNGDSCRACHFEPVIGGAGPRGVNVTRHGFLTEGEFTAPAAGTILHRVTSLLSLVILAEDQVTIFEHRQTPPLFGLGLVDQIPDETITANADPEDEDGDGISGRISVSEGGRLGRFGWKAQVPSLAEFVRDGAANELGLTLPPQEGLTFGQVFDDDDVADPELSLSYAEELLVFMQMLAPPPRKAPDDPEAAARGEELFDSVGCAKCHTPSLDSPSGPVELYSDLLLHEILPETSLGIEEFSAGMREFRTAPLWGISESAPYMHSGAADSLDQAIRLHAGEAADIRDAYQDLAAPEREALVEFLETL